MKFKDEDDCGLSLYTRIKISIIVWINMHRGRIPTALWFTLRAWKILIGKECIVQTDRVISKGGFRYLRLDLAVLPLTTHKEIKG